MIRMLTGRIAAVTDTGVVLDVRGVGYLVYTTSPSLFDLDSHHTLHTYLAVRETALDLYGFTTESELALFSLLLQVPKVGPKSALHILSQANPALLIESISANDAGRLHKVSGIGKKTAENVVQYLHDKIDTLSTHTRSEHPATMNTKKSDAIDALVSLGYELTNARQAVQQYGEELSVNELITKALKELT